MILQSAAGGAICIGYQCDQTETDNKDFDPFDSASIVS